MKIKLKAPYVGPRGVFAPGAVLDLPEVEATALVSGGYASHVAEPPAAPVPAAPVAVETPVVVETADLPEPEQSVAPRRGKRAR